MISPLLTAWLEQEELLGCYEKGQGMDWGERRCERLESGCNFKSSVFGEWQVRVGTERSVSVRVYLLWSLKLKIDLPLLYSREIRGQSTGIY